MKAAAILIVIACALYAAWDAFTSHRNWPHILAPVVIGGPVVWVLWST